MWFQQDRFFFPLCVLMLRLFAVCLVDYGQDDASSYCECGFRISSIDLLLSEFSSP